MNWIDGLILGVLALSAFVGFRKGALRSIIILLTLNAGLALSSRFGQQVGDVFSPLTSDYSLRAFAGVGVIALVFTLLIVAIIYALNSLREYWGGSSLFKWNRRLGIVFAVGAGFTLLAGTLTSAQHFPIPRLDEDIDESALGSFVADTVDEAILFLGIIPGDWLEKSDNKNRDALANHPQLYEPPPQPVELKNLAEQYAPVIFMDTADREPVADYLTRWDFDGTRDTTDNWKNLTAKQDVDLSGQVYYWVSETEDHWFIGYSFFHPRDWGEKLVNVGLTECVEEEGALEIGCHENDMEGALVTVLRSPDQPYGTFLTLETVAHSDILSFRDEDSELSASVEGNYPSCNRKRCDVEFLDGTSHPYIYIEAQSHAVSGSIKNRPRWERNFPGGDGVLYFPTSEATVPLNGDDRGAGYELVDIKPLWELRGDSEIFTPGGQFRGDDGLHDAASPPWGWVDKDFLELGSVLFADPARWINAAHEGLVPADVTYTARTFDGD